MPVKPGSVRNAASVLPFAGRLTDELPIRVPELSKTVIVTVSALFVGFAIATAVV
jgi:hypothetical protein